MKASTRTLTFLIAASLACVIAPVAHATLLVVRPLATMVTETDHIVVVTGISETSRWDRFGRIVSDMQLHVTDVVKGRLARGEDVTVTRLGGSIGDLAMTVAGEANLASGERAVLFLDDVNDAGVMRVSHMSLGQFPIVVQHGVPTVVPSGAGLSLVVEGDDGALKSTAAPLQVPMPLSDFLAVLRDLAGSR